jgi:RNA-directed DNA polymerase
MKRHGNLWEKIVSYENLFAAHKAASRGKRHYRSVLKVDDNIQEYIFEIQRLLNTGEFKTGKYKRSKIVERGKEREIFSLPYFPDRIIQHAFVQVLFPIWQSSMIRGTYSSIPGRGIHDAKTRLAKELRENPSETVYCLKIDIRKFYPSINHQKMMLIIREKIKDKKVLAVLDEVICSIHVTSKDTGIPIGNYLSQWFANIYLAEMDWKIKQFYKIKYYHRYCDDAVIIHKYKPYLHLIRKELSKWLADEFKLDIKNNWQVFQIAERGIDFIGYRFWHDKILLRKGIKRRMAKRLSIQKGKKSEASYRNSEKAVASYNGWLSHGSTRNLRNKILPPWIEMINYENSKQ